MITTVGVRPARIDIDAVAGEPVDFTVPVYDANGAAQDVAGWTLTATARTAGGAALHTFTTAAVAPTGTTGTTGYDPGGIRVTATGAETAAWAAWTSPANPWSLWITPPVSEPDLLAAGWVRVTTY